MSRIVPTGMVCEKFLLGFFNPCGMGRVFCGCMERDFLTFFWVGVEYRSCEHASKFLVHLVVRADPGW